MKSLQRRKDLAKVAGNKTEEVVELTRLKIQASQLRGDIDANYLKLGEIIYELNKAGTENEELSYACALLRLSLRQDRGLPS